MTYNFRNRSQNVSYAEASDEENDFCMMIESLSQLPETQRNDHGNVRRRGRRPSRPNQNADINTLRWRNRRTRDSNSRSPRTVLQAFQINERISSEPSRMVEVDESLLNVTDDVPESSNTLEQNLTMETDPSSINERRNASDQEMSNNQEQNVMMEANPSSMNERVNVPEVSHIEPGPSSISAPMLRATTETSSQQPDTTLSKKTILAWLTACKAIDEGGQVRYKGGVKTITGRISNGAIICSCCDQEFSVWDFEKHNKSTQQQPYKNIFLIKYNRPLEQSIIGAWMSAEEQNRRSMFSYVPDEEKQTHDNSCLVCGDGGEGETIFCDKCPSTYHKSCAHMQNIRVFEDWLCFYCRCKFCEVGEENEHLVTCCHCLKKFHWSCIENSDKDELMKTPLLSCSRNCKKIYESLEGLLGIQNRIPGRENFSLSIVRQMDAIHDDHHVSINSKVAVACMLMNEAFRTIKDARTGNNLVQSVLYNKGSNLRRLNFSRFYTFVMEKNDTMISAAPLRFYGKDIAEMPFFATDGAFRGKGFCRLFVGLIEQFLLNLKIKQWIISSTQESLEMWKEKFNFDLIIDRALKRKVSSCNMLVLPHVIRLHKKIYGVQDLNMAQVLEE